jgi:hypothetical protein
MPLSGTQELSIELLKSDPDQHPPCFPWSARTAEVRWAGLPAFLCVQAIPRTRQHRGAGKAAGGPHIWKQTSQIGVDPPREFHVVPILRRVWCCGNRQYHRGNRDRSHDKARPLLAAMAMAKCAEGKKPPLKMALSAPIWGYWRSLGSTSLFCVRGISHDTEPTRHSCRRD